jgi:hypothetical protein
MARGGHGFPKVSPGPAMPYAYTPFRQATPEMAFSGVGRPQARQSAAVFYTFGYPRPYAYAQEQRNSQLQSEIKGGPKIGSTGISFFFLALMFVLRTSDPGA